MLATKESTIVLKGGSIQTTGTRANGAIASGAGARIVLSDLSIQAAAGGAHGVMAVGGGTMKLTNVNMDTAGIHAAAIATDRGGGTIIATGGTLRTSGESSPALYSTGTISISGVKLSSISGVLIQASADRWGRKGANGGHAILIAERQTLRGSLIVGDTISSIDATLHHGTTLTEAVQGASLTLDATSKWSVEADSALAGLTEEANVSEKTISNIIGNGHTVTYKASNAQNAWLGGKTYPLSGGGELKAANE